MPQTQLSPNEEQQEKLLDESLSIIKVQSFHMKCCLDKGQLMEALKHASNMLSELRTSLLSPRSYYELYMAVTDQLRHLELFLVDEFERNNKIFELYELVQYAGNIIPRLYLLISVGLVYMKTSPNCRKEILRDLVEMCRGVQHPLRGLFLRNFLLQTCRHVLPDLPLEEGFIMDRFPNNSTSGDDSSQTQPTQYVSSTLSNDPNVHSNGDCKSNDTGTVMDSIEFVLANFAEMNKLWVRMQHLGHTREREKREKERLELRLLVGTNLVRLSQLESIDAELYTKVVLPGILEQVVSCKDSIAQEYLMESLIQVFPDEFHLATLNPFLSSCAQLAPDVKVKNIIIALVDRLAASHDISLPDDLFDNFSQQISNIISNRTTVPIDDIIIMQGSLINFSLKKITDQSKREESINSVLQATLKAIKDMNVVIINLRSNLGKEMFRFLKLPFNLSATIPSDSTSGSNNRPDFGLIKMSLKLDNLKNLIKETCDIELHKQIILTLLNETLENSNDDQLTLEDRLTPAEIHTFLTELCSPLVNGTNQVLLSESPKTNAVVAIVDDQNEDFIDEQLLLSRFIHYLLLNQCIEGDNSNATNESDSDSIQLLDTTYLTLSSIRKILATGGPSRIRYTYPSLVFEALQLSLKYFSLKEKDDKWMKKCQKIYQYVNQLIMSLLKESNCPDLCLQLFLEAALNCSKSGITDRESISYEFVSQAFAIYEEEISDSKSQTLCLLLIISTVKNVKFENADNFTPLRNQCCLNCGKLVKISDRCRAILSASTLFIDDEAKKLEPEIVKCFKKCMKISSTLLDATLQLQLYVEILSNLTLYVKYKHAEINELIHLLASMINDKRKDTALPDLIITQYNNSIKFFEQNGVHIVSQG